MCRCKTIGYRKKFQVADFFRTKSLFADGNICPFYGSVAERFKALVLKTSDGVSHP